MRETSRAPWPARSRLISPPRAGIAATVAWAMARPGPTEQVHDPQPDPIPQVELPQGEDVPPVEAGTEMEPLVQPATMEDEPTMMRAVRPSERDGLMRPSYGMPR